MNIFVIMKRTFGTEEIMFFNDGPIDVSGAEHIINPYDENNRFRWPWIREEEVHAKTNTVEILCRLKNKQENF